MTKEISTKESFDWFMTTLGRYDNSHLKLSDDELLSIILDELDIEAVSFLHNDTVERLIENNLIPADIANAVDALRNKTMILLQDKRTVDDIRNDSDWKFVRRLADQIKNKIQKVN